MSRQRRKRFERIHTKRAKAGFPRVSPSIFHNDGTIEAAPQQRYRVVLSPTFQEQLRALSSTDQHEIMQAVQKLQGNPYRGRRIIASPIERIHDWLLWLWHELRLIRYWSILNRHGLRAAIWQWFYDHKICPECLKHGRVWELFPFHEHEEI